MSGWGGQARGGEQPVTHDTTPLSAGGPPPRCIRPKTQTKEKQSQARKNTTRARKLNSSKRKKVLKPKKKNLNKEKKASKKNIHDEKKNFARFYFFNVEDKI